VRAHHTRQRGITLVELLVAMAIMGVVSAMLLTGWFALTESYSYTVKSADARDSGRQAIARVQREIRITPAHKPARIPQERCGGFRG